LLKEQVVWEALLPGIGITALIRNLATMTRVGLIAPGSAGTSEICARLGNMDIVRKGRVHPIQVLSALVTYQHGKSERGHSTWTPVTSVVDALDRVFYGSFGTVESTGKRLLLALDISGSMGSGQIAGVPGLTPRVGSAAMALVTAAVERDPVIVGFTGQYSLAQTSLTPLHISARQRLDDVVRAISQLPMGATDCALPMLYALEHKLAVDAFVIYTDNETWAGRIHPMQALKRYRDRTGIPAKLVVVGMTATQSTIGDPNDTGVLDVVGFDTAMPTLIGHFIRAP
jgi:60 kDa SS-A/Ro ribonucleoprotein